MNAVGGWYIRLLILHHFVCRLHSLRSRNTAHLSSVIARVFRRGCKQSGTGLIPKHT